MEGSFEPENNIGWYQMEIYNSENKMMYGAHAIVSEHLIPQNREDFLNEGDWGLALSEMEDGVYTLNVNVHSIAPDGSGGLGIEYSSRDPNEFITFSISNGDIIIP